LVKEKKGWRQLAREKIFFKENCQIIRNLGIEIVSLERGRIFTVKNSLRHTMCTMNEWINNERRRIYAAGLDVVAVERLKYLFRHFVRPDLFDNESDIIFERVDEWDSAYPKYGSIVFVYVRGEKEQDLEITCKAEVYYECKLAVDLDPRMYTTNPSTVNRAWMEHRLKK
jgi:hypothetical protein